MNLVLFDFDKTLTTKDSFIEFLKFTTPKHIYYGKLLLLAPWVVAYLLGVIKTTTLKNKFLSVFFKGEEKTSLLKKGQNFSDTKIKHFINYPIYNEFLNHKQHNKVVVVSASLDIWLKPWCAKHKVELICTKTAFNHNKFEGKIIPPNIKGIIKKNMVLEHYNLENYNQIFVYGNKGLDNELFKLASSKNHIHII